MSESELPSTESSSIFCLEHCNGACCRDNTLHNVSSTDLPKFTANARWKLPFSSITQLNSLIDNFEDGVFYAPEDTGAFYVHINGPCPNLSRDGACTKQDDKPIQCQTFEVFSADCIKVRQRDKVTDETLHGKKRLPVLQIFKRK